MICLVGSRNIADIFATDRYGCTILVWYEVFETREEAFRRERRIKGWRRSWKLRLIEADNPTWRDLFADLNLNA